MPPGSIAGRDSVFASLSRLRPVSTGRLPLTALAEERRAGLFRFCAARACANPAGAPRITPRVRACAVITDFVPAYMILSCPKNFFKALLLRECSILQILKCDKEFVLSLNRYFVCTNFVRFYSVFGDFLHVFWKKNFLYIIFWKKISFFFNIFVFLQKNDVNLNLRVWNN
jgi:hypothetical protein